MVSCLKHDVFEALCKFTTPVATLDGRVSSYPRFVFKKDPPHFGSLCSWTSHGVADLGSVKWVSVSSKKLVHFAVLGFFKSLILATNAGPSHQATTGETG